MQNKITSCEIFKWENVLIHFSSMYLSNVLSELYALEIYSTATKERTA